MVGKELERVAAALLLTLGVTSWVMGCVPATPSVPPLVSRGLSGNPFRLLCRPEATIFTLHPA